MDVTRYQYINHSQNVNTDNIYSHVKPIKQNVEANKEVEKEEVAAVYFNYQNNQAMKSRMELLAENSSQNDEPEELSYKQIHELQEQKNKNTLLAGYTNNEKYSNQNKESSLLELWV